MKRFIIKMLVKLDFDEKSDKNMYYTKSVLFVSFLYC